MVPLPNVEHSNWLMPRSSPHTWRPARELIRNEFSMIPGYMLNDTELIFVYVTDNRLFFN